MTPRVQHLLERLNWRPLAEHCAWLLEKSTLLQQIPAPTFQEAQRAAQVLSEMQALGMESIAIDELSNVYGLIRGEQPDAPALLISAHTDTIFPQDTDLSLRCAPDLIAGPGLGDNAIGAASLLALARYLRSEGITPACNIWFVATSREEGLGDLGGMRAAFERLRAQVGCVINIEGLAYGHVYNGGIAVRRLHIKVRTEGGHSWLHFGRPSAIHSLIELGARLLTIRPPVSPRSTYNIGMIGGGTAINAIATEAYIWLDLRSETQDGLAQLEAQVMNYVHQMRREDLQLTVETVGDRPAGMLLAHHPLVQDALEILRLLGVQGTLEAGSTDGNIPLAFGCPTVTIGITRGGNAHRLDEYIELTPIGDGLRQLIVLALITTERLARVL